ncbi:MAG TPA: lytic transglycosylase domain-containing protein [Solirubrobacterales bacterium]|nr:lytic transglycosylase domain-containing protein [Solirubrobacterales bacterium]
MKTKAFASLLLLLCPLAGTAEVRVGVGASGRRIIWNESADQHARRLSGRLVAVPDAALLPMIDRHAGSQQLDPRLVKAVIQVESGYNPRALSKAGAMGLMQLMPETARDLSVRDPYDPEENLRAGTAYLRQLLDRFRGSVELALAAYNAGPEPVERHGGIPPYAETRDYVRHILSLYMGHPVDLGPTLASQMTRSMTGLASRGLAITAGVRRIYLTRPVGSARLLLTTAIDPRK